MKFKIGDRVRETTRDTFGVVNPGMVGVVSRESPKYPDVIGVDFGASATRDMHDLDGALPGNTGWYVHEDYLELLPEAAKSDGTREIKPGSKWRNVHGEVTVDDNDPDISFSIADAPFAMDEQFFRMTHEWVSDPAPAVKVGDWVEYDGTPCLVVPDCASADTDEYLFPVIWLGHVREYEAIPPPPLIQALEAWVAAVEKQYPDGHSQPLVQRLVDEYRAIKRKLGVES